MIKLSQNRLKIP